MNEWRKSSYSFSNGNCTEVAAWRRAARCQTSKCVQVGQGAAVVGVRDSRDPGGPVLAFGAAAWAAFLARVRA